MCKLMEKRDMETIKKIIEDYNNCENIKLAVFSEGNKNDIINEIINTIENYEVIESVFILGSKVISFQSRYPNTRFEYYFTSSFDYSIQTEIFEEFNKYCDKRQINISYYNDF